MEFEHEILHIDDNIQIVVTSDHKFGTDAFLLADFAKPRHKDCVGDLGTGCGIIPFVLEQRFSPQKIVGIDIQEKAVDQFKKGIALSHLSHKITPLQADLKQISQHFESGGFDVITCNPPYKRKGTGLKNPQTAHAIARHEICCTIEEVCGAASYLLTQGGKLCLCQRPERLLDVLEAMRAHNIEPKVLRFVSRDGHSAPWLFLVEGKKFGNPHLTILPQFVVYQGQDYTEEMRKIYEKQEK